MDREGADGAGVGLDVVPAGGGFAAQQAAEERGEQEALLHRGAAWAWAWAPLGGAGASAPRSPERPLSSQWEGPNGMLVGPPASLGYPSFSLRHREVATCRRHRGRTPNSRTEFVR